MWTDLSSVMSQFTGLTNRQTDGQTDSFLIARPRLHSTQRGKNQTTVQQLKNQSRRELHLAPPLSPSLCNPRWVAAPFIVLIENTFIPSGVSTKSAVGFCLITNPRMSYSRPPWRLPLWKLTTRRLRQWVRKRLWKSTCMLLIFMSLIR